MYAESIKSHGYNMVVSRRKASLVNVILAVSEVTFEMARAKHAG